MKATRPEWVLKGPHCDVKIAHVVGPTSHPSRPSTASLTSPGACPSGPWAGWPELPSLCWARGYWGMPHPVPQWEARRQRGLHDFSPPLSPSLMEVPLHTHAQMFRHMLFFSDPQDPHRPHPIATGTSPGASRPPVPTLPGAAPSAPLHCRPHTSGLCRSENLLPQRPPASSGPRPPVPE